MGFLLMNKKALMMIVLCTKVLVVELVGLLFRVSCWIESEPLVLLFFFAAFLVASQ